MQRTLTPTAIGAALIALCASTGTWGAEIDFNTLPVPPEPPVQSGAPAQPDAWVPARAAATEPAPEAGRREDDASSGGAMFMPFAASSQAPSAAPHEPPRGASRTGDAADLGLTVFAVLAGVGAIAWLLRRA